LEKDPFTKFRKRLGKPKSGNQRANYPRRDTRYSG
jgi:hypothetical protein